jgi:hypothetical protein
LCWGEDEGEVRVRARVADRFGGGLVLGGGGELVEHLVDVVTDEGDVGKVPGHNSTRRSRWFTTVVVVVVVVVERQA